MALLKKGSKGKDVEKLQEALNKFGVKPELKVDGIFGPKTEKGLIQAQTKLKLEKVDGKAGDFTMAAINYGKPLPKLNVSVSPNLAQEIKILRTHNVRAADIYAEIGKEVSALDSFVFSRNETVGKLVKKSDSAVDVLIDYANDFQKIQKDFDDQLIKNPASAEKIAKSADADFDLFEKVFQAFCDNMDERVNHAKAMRAELESKLKIIGKKLDEIAQSAESAKKSVAKLNRKK